MASPKAKIALLLLSAVFALQVSLTGAWSAEEKGGKATYEKLCATCHGVDGKGNPMMAKTFGERALNVATKETARKKDEELLNVITEGRGKMPASGKGLSKAELKPLLDYTRSLAK